jgi:hypothetical protein
MAPLPENLPSADAWPDPSADGTFHIRPDQVVALFELLSYVHEQWSLCHAAQPSNPPVQSPEAP